MGLHFRQVIKCINSEWDYDELGMTMNTKGQTFRTYYIKSGNSRFPTVAECLAIADYMGYIYTRRGYFLQEIK